LPAWELETDMRFVMILLLGSAAAMLSACDKASAPREQEQEIVSSPNTPPDAEPIAANRPNADIGLESSSGLKAILSYTLAGRQAPNVKFTGADGRDVSLSDFSGRPLLVNIWATWCAPCKAEMPTLDALAALEAGKVSVIAVSQDLEGRKPVAAYFKEKGFANLEPYIDPDNALLGSLGGNVELPTTILYDSKGREVWRVIGGVEWDDAEMAKLIAEAQ
jgi:thiol-disulfide isomerase/thioredoxin